MCIRDRLYGKRIIYRRAHLACHKALPDKPIEAILVFGKGILDAFGCSAHVCRTNCLVRILCFPLGFINDSFRVYKGIPIGCPLYTSEIFLIFYTFCFNESETA